MPRFYNNTHFHIFWTCLKVHSSLRQFLVTESLFKIMKNAFCFTLKALFLLKIFKFLSSLFGHTEKRRDQKYQVNFNIHDIKN